MEDKNIQPDQQEDPALYKARFAQLLKRRKMFFGSLIIYIPIMWVMQQLAPKSMLTAFGIWVVIMVAVMLYSALAVCPRCGNYFHMNGMTLLYFRKCLHCQLHVKDNKQS
ncbi:hypothetical protein [Pelotalea chapellei]|uniref:Uncharacterized protein n=1 Tax=Pelotalea chapellei TaxID=44671 RepID=A0ABS5U9U0_9BACT|nr:hypothetical protein [Pelotalea chapellei]MBT1072415.1 hypothetical protein [Pelotalea chapellei]